MRRYEDAPTITTYIDYDCNIPRAVERELLRKDYISKRINGFEIQDFYTRYSKEDETITERESEGFIDNSNSFEKSEQAHLQKITEAIFKSVFSNHDAIRLKEILLRQETERFTILTDSLITAILNPNLPESNLEINDYLLSTDTAREELLFGRCGDGIDIARAYMAYLSVGFDPTNILSRNEIFIRLSVLSNLKEILNQIPNDSEDDLLFRNSVHCNFDYIVQMIELILGSLELNGWDKSISLEDQFEYSGLVEINGNYKFKFGATGFRHFFRKLNLWPDKEIRFQYSSLTRVVRKKGTYDEHIVFALNAFNPNNTHSKGIIIRNFLNRLNVAASIFNGKVIGDTKNNSFPSTDLSHQAIYKILEKTHTVSLNIVDELVDLVALQKYLGIKDKDCAKGVLKYVEYELMRDSLEALDSGFLFEAAMHHEA